MIRSDIRNKEIALGRIKRLASSGLPFEPFVRVAFELINDAICNSDHKVFHVGGVDGLDKYFGNSPEIVAAVPFQKHFFVDSPPEVGGTKFRYDAYAYTHILPRRTVWTQEEICHPGLYRAEGYNQVYRPLGWHKLLQVVFAEAGEYLGYCPIWRTVDQKPFSREDSEFLKASAPHIAHGLRSAHLLTHGLPASVNVDQELIPLDGWHSGVILLDEGGRPIAIDAAARLIFQQVAIFDGIGSDAFASRPIQAALEYVQARIAQIFTDPDGGSFDGPAPVYRLFNHWTGSILKLRAVRMFGEGTGAFTSIIVERSETAAMRRRRYQLRWGLSDREAEVLALVGNGKTGPEISTILGISHDTARKHLARIFVRLGVENRTEAALKVRDAKAFPIGASLR